MTLDDYLSQTGQTAAALAQRAGTTGASIARLRRGKQRPSAAMIRAIVEATGGAVSAGDLVFGPDSGADQDGRPVDHAVGNTADAAAAATGIINNLSGGA